MSQMSVSLFRKYRPETFADFVGQEHIANTLKRAIATGSTADAYLFSGPRGTGKTSTARLLAKALLCEHPADGEPDDSCEQCREIAAGVHPDVYELDAASRTGVDNVRDEIISRVAFAPIRGSYKIYIIDEVHMLSVAAFNALLKTLEEPPAHVKFVLCTTDPAKVPQTIQSRCQRFDFHRFNAEEIIGNLRRVSEAEGFEADEQALQLIASHAQGGMRDALVALEQIAVFGGGEVSLSAAEDMLGQVRPEQLEAICLAIADRDLAGCLSWAADLAMAGTDIAQFARELARHLRDLYVSLLLGRDDQAAAQAWGLSDTELARLREQSARFGSADRLAACLGLAAELNQQLKGTSDDRLCLEMALIRMARPESDLSLEALSARLSAVEAALAGSGPGGAVGVGGDPGAGVAAAVATCSGPATTVPAGPTSAGAAPVGVAAAGNQGTGPAACSAIPVGVQGTGPVADCASSVDTVAASPAPAVPVGGPPAASSADTSHSLRDNSDAQRLWVDILRRLRRSGQQRLLGLLDATRARFDEASGGLLIELPENANFTLQSLEHPELRELLDQAIAEVYGQPLPARYQLGYGRQASAAAPPAEQPPTAPPPPATAPPPPAEQLPVAPAAAPGPAAGEPVASAAAPPPPAEQPPVAPAAAPGPAAAEPVASVAAPPAAAAPQAAPQAAAAAPAAAAPAAAAPAAAVEPPAAPLDTGSAAPPAAPDQAEPDYEFLSTDDDDPFSPAKLLSQAFGSPVAFEAIPDEPIAVRGDEAPPAPVEPDTLSLLEDEF